jgi:L-lysine exporter family protein LysE/ArgO
LGLGHYLTGFLLGLALILPIGMQNLFVLQQGLLGGGPRVLLAVLSAGACDTLLILLGATGAAALLAAAPGLEAALLVAGAGFLAVLGARTLAAQPPRAARPGRGGPAAVALQAVGVSLLNPHAVLDTVGVIGGAVAAQPPDGRVAFAAGAVTASWAWFLFLGAGATLLAPRLTAAVRRWIQRGSGLLMLGFAGLLALRALAPG